MDLSKGWTVTLALIGSLTALSWLVTVLRFIYLHLLYQSQLPKYRKGSGDRTWALVTGASDGIGKAFALALAERGFNVVLHGRNETKLNGVKQELQKLQSQRQFQIWVLDASKAEGMAAAVEQKAVALEKLPGPLRVLINNCGGASMLPAPMSSLVEHRATDVEGIIHLNNTFTVQLTRALVPLLQKNGPALVINCGSFAGLFANPFLSVYSGTKHFLHSWGSSLSREMKAQQTGIEVLTILIGQVFETSAFRQKGTLFTPSARALSLAILGKVGCGRELVAAYWAHALQGAIIGLFPRSVQAKIMTGVALQLRNFDLAKKE